MSSLLPGHHPASPSGRHDIFVSYRQKDNRSDQWVTSFVQALKEELDATFKEEIYVYFDENPHDGLLGAGIDPAFFKPMPIFREQLK